ncbi:uncharacterized protein A4U43_C07F23310 [Asparagus officinalis]|uniref:Uncharacterized protein n=1 Tax=Asparagus officinalis TaxID=4686 RepID=A0A5P1EEK4_ASPOF|nr:uncharacterized protein A4U43_C07F23310 [Asparagus officinalis]
MTASKLKVGHLNRNQIVIHHQIIWRLTMGLDEAVSRVAVQKGLGARGEKVSYSDVGDRGDKPEKMYEVLKRQVKEFYFGTVA